jgi:uncharacterized membrane protein
MVWLVIGVALWSVAHLFKRVMPGPRAAMSERMGDASKGVFAVILVVAVVLMVIGYRAADVVPVWYPPAWTVHLNNLLMLFAVALFGVGNSKSRLRGKLRHPMLLGFLTWAVAHLLVNGDVASLVLFGVLAVWALVEIAVINAAEPRYERWTGGSLKGDIRLAIIALVLYAIISGLHIWLGPWPFAA